MQNRGGDRGRRQRERERKETEEVEVAVEVDTYSTERVRRNCGYMGDRHNHTVSSIQHQHHNL